MNNGIKLLIAAVSLNMVSGCATTGFSYAKDPNMVRKIDGTVISVKDRNIYNGVCWSLNPLPFTCPVQSVGLAVKVVLADGKTIEIIQPKIKQYTLAPNDRIVLLVDQGKTWVQPIDYPLPPDFVIK